VNIEFKFTDAGQIQANEVEFDVGDHRYHRREIGRFNVSQARALLNDLTVAIKQADIISKSLKAKSREEKRGRLLRLKNEVASLEKELGA
jgi:hypothetical protein